MIGIVVVSHSAALGQAVADLAAEMVPAEARPKLAVAAGLDAETFGTDATAIAAAISEVDSPDGVLVLVDLGSAILSAQMALEFVEPEVAARTQVSSAPLVEGLMAALVTASMGASLDDVAAEARAGLIGKQEQVGDVAPEARAGLIGKQEQVGEVAPDARAGLIGEQEQAGEVAASGPLPAVTPAVEAFTWTIRNPHGLHARPAANLIAGLRGLTADIQLSNATLGKGPVSARSLTAVQTLGLRKDDVLAAQITGADAAQAKATLASLARHDFGENSTARPTASGATASGATASGPTASRPTAADPTAADPTASDPARDGRQIVIGPARHLTVHPDTAGYQPASPEAECARLDEAVSAVQDVLDRLAAGAAADIYQVQGLILQDEGSQAQLRQAIAGGASAVAAVRELFGAAAAQLEQLDDPYLRARAEDQRGVERMLLRALLGQDVAPAQACPEAATASPEAASSVLILDELDPVTAGSLDPERCAGIITTAGGATGHGAIVAQARGFALLTGQAEAAGVPDGAIVALDPVAKRLWIDPAEPVLADLRARQTARIAEAKAAAEHTQEPALTRSGIRVLVEANVASLADAQQGNAAGADGSGLVRTEVLFADWQHAPTAAEQAAEFIRIGQALPGKPITIRTWDPGGDKPLAFLPQTPEANPMLGERGIRAMRRLPELLDEQLKAILLASREVPVRVMFPMISLPAELAWARERLATARASLAAEDLTAPDPPDVPAGMMVETPAAALRAAEFLPLADFISIGTNDLTQYTMAVDRGNPTVAAVAAGDNNGVWDLIAMAARTFAGKPVAVCGDLASDPAAAARLVGLGVSELSVRPPLVGALKQAVRAAR